MSEIDNIYEIQITTSDGEIISYRGNKAVRSIIAKLNGGIASSSQPLSRPTRIQPAPQPVPRQQQLPQQYDPWSTTPIILDQPQQQPQQRYPTYQEQQPQNDPWAAERQPTLQSQPQFYVDPPISQIEPKVESRLPLKGGNGKYQAHVGSVYEVSKLSAKELAEQMRQQAKSSGINF
jgi:hypothetical protein